MPIKVTEGGTPRSKLGEGRNYGFGSAICKKINDEHYETLCGITACKDFLHDLLMSEHLDVPVNIYSLKYTKQNAFIGDYTYFAIKMLPSKSGDDYGMAKEAELLDKNINNLIIFINHFEEEMKVNGRTSLSLTEDKDVYLLVTPIFWVSTTYLISLYTLLIRIAYRYDGQQNMTDYVKGLLANEDAQGDYGNDLGMLKHIYPKYEECTKIGFPKENFKKRLAMLGEGTGWHNAGIVSVVLSGDKKSKWLE